MSARTSKWKIERVLALKAEGHTQAFIAAETGLNQATVSLIEHAAGLARQRKRSRRKSFADDATGFPLHNPRRK